MASLTRQDKFLVVAGVPVFAVIAALVFRTAVGFEACGKLSCMSDAAATAVRVGGALAAGILVAACGFGVAAALAEEGPAQQRSRRFVLLSLVGLIGSFVWFVIYLLAEVPKAG